MPGKLSLHPLAPVRQNRTGTREHPPLCRFRHQNAYGIKSSSRFPDRIPPWLNFFPYYIQNSAVSVFYNSNNPVCHFNRSGNSCQPFCCLLKRFDRNRLNSSCCQIILYLLIIFMSGIQSNSCLRNHNRNGFSRFAYR